MEILIFAIALIVVVNDFVISISVTGLVSISNLDTGSDVHSPVSIGISIDLPVSASVDKSISTLVGSLMQLQH